MTKLISTEGESQNLLIRDAELEECAELQKLCYTWEDVEKVTGEPIDRDYIYRCLTEGDLPPLADAVRERYMLKSICLKESGRLIGFFDVYHGYPVQDTLWISLFLIDKAYRGIGYGQEVLDYLTEEAKVAQFARLGIGVHLKNWPALRFWSKAGFNTIAGIFGDKVYGEDAFAVVSLYKSLR